MRNRNEFKEWATQSLPESAHLINRVRFDTISSIDENIRQTHSKGLVQREWKQKRPQELSVRQPNRVMRISPLEREKIDENCRRPSKQDIGRRRIFQTISSFQECLCEVERQARRFKKHRWTPFIGIACEWNLFVLNEQRVGMLVQQRLDFGRDG